MIERGGGKNTIFMMKLYENVPLNIDYASIGKLVGIWNTFTITLVCRNNMSTLMIFYFRCHLTEIAHVLDNARRAL